MQSCSLVPAAELVESWSAVQHIQALGQIVLAIRVAVWSTGIPPTFPQPESPPRTTVTARTPRPAPTAAETILPNFAPVDLMVRPRASALQFWETTQVLGALAKVPVIPRPTSPTARSRRQRSVTNVRFLTHPGSALRRSSNPDKTETRTCPPVWSDDRR